MVVDPESEHFASVSLQGIHLHALRLSEHGSAVGTSMPRESSQVGIAASVPGTPRVTNTKPNTDVAYGGARWNATWGGVGV